MSTDYSQWGEQAIIRRILDTLPERDYWCVDVGAGDGIKLSNTRALIEDGYSGVLIEGNPVKCQNLRDVTPANVDTFCKYVDPIGDHSLKSILANTRTPADFDFLSIDIDGLDYHVWAELKGYYPKVVCIEFNPTMGTDLNFVQPIDSDHDCGSSIRSIISLGESKGYRLAWITLTNALFVQERLWDHCEVENGEILDTRDTALMTWMYYDYAGNGHAIGHMVSPWTVSTHAAD